eukprot:1790368-Amphidinium_carterae.1
MDHATASELHVLWFGLLIPQLAPNNLPQPQTLKVNSTRCATATKKRKEPSKLTTPSVSLGSDPIPRSHERVCACVMVAAVCTFLGVAKPQQLSPPLVYCCIKDQKHNAPTQAVAMSYTHIALMRAKY